MDISASPTPYSGAVAITPSDSTNLTVTPTRAIHVGGAGNVVVVFMDGSAITLLGCLAGHIYPVAAKRVNSTSTTATSLVALY